MKIGRNAPCPCGSGKKYKKCCLGKSAVPSQALYYRRLSEVHDRLANRLVDYASRVFGEAAVQVAMDEFLGWPEPEDEIGEEMLDRIGPLFWPWFMFNWEYVAIDSAVELSGPEDQTVAELYAAEHGAKLDPIEHHLIDNINRKPYSFWEVLSVDKGKSMKLQDVLRGIRITVQERMGSEYVHAGDLLFGRAVEVDGVGMIIGLSTMIIPPIRKPEIIHLRKKLRLSGDNVTDEILYDWDIEIRELYFHLDRSLHTRPQLHNTDGHPFEFHRLIYDINSVGETFERLKDLCTTMTPEELLTDAKRDKGGHLRQVEIQWDRKGHKASPGMSNTILGRILITENRLTAEVNSAERAKTLRREIDKRLGDGGHFKVDEIQDLDSMLSKAEAEVSVSNTSKEHDELMQYPEVREQVAEMLCKHWESWVDQKIPALAGKTPRAAVKTADGREAVEALLVDAERGRGRDDLTAEANREGVQRVRKILGLRR